MLISDLHTFPPGHPPSPYPLPVVDRLPSGDRYAVLAPGLALRAVAWLGAEVPTRGVTPPECIDRLVKALDSAEVIAEGMRGDHGCEVCQTLGTFFPGTDEFYRRRSRRRDGRPGNPESFRALASVHPVIRWRETEYAVKSRGHHLIQLDRIVYMCPQLILHYILHHEYRPPDEFLQAIVHGHFLAFEDLSILPKGGENEWIDRLRATRRE